MILAEDAQDAFYGLSSFDENTRMASSEVLMQTVLKDSKDLEKMAYLEDRLLKGLVSSNQASRQGFAMSLCRLWTTQAKNKVDANIAKVISKTIVTRRMKASEVKDHLFGRLFGLAAVVKSLDRQQLTENTINSLIEGLFELMLKKSYLVRPSTRALASLLEMGQELIVLKVESQLSVLLGNKQRTIFAAFGKAIHKVKSPEVLMICLKCLESEDVQHWKLKEFSESLNQRDNAQKMNLLLCRQVTGFVTRSIAHSLINVFASLERNSDDPTLLKPLDKILICQGTNKNLLPIVSLNAELMLSLLNYFARESEFKGTNLVESYFLGDGFASFFRDAAVSKQLLEYSSWPKDFRAALLSLSDLRVTFSKNFLFSCLENNNWSLTSGFARHFLPSLAKKLLKDNKINLKEIVQSATSAEKGELERQIISLLPPEESLAQCVRLLKMDITDEFAFKQALYVEGKMSHFATALSKLLKERSKKSKKLVIKLLREAGLVSSLDKKDLTKKDLSKHLSLLALLDEVLLRLHTLLLQLKNSSNPIPLRELLDVCNEIQDARTSVSYNHTPGQAILIVVDNMLSLLAQLPMARPFVNVSILQLLKCEDSIVVNNWRKASNLVLSAACMPAKLVQEDLEEEDSVQGENEDESSIEEKSDVDETEKIEEYVKVIEDSGGVLLDKTDDKSSKAYDEALENFVVQLLESRANRKSAKKQLELQNHDFRMRSVDLLQKLLISQNDSAREDIKVFKLEAYRAIYEAMTDCINTKGVFVSSLAIEIFKKFANLLSELKFASKESFPSEFTFEGRTVKSTHEVSRVHLQELLSKYKSNLNHKLKIVLNASLTSLLESCSVDTQIKLFGEIQFKALLRKQGNKEFFLLLENLSESVRLRILEVFLNGFEVSLKSNTQTSSQLANAIYNLKRCTKIILDAGTPGAADAALFRTYLFILTKHSKAVGERGSLRQSQQLGLLQQLIKLKKFNEVIELQDQIFIWYSDEVKKGRLQNPHLLGCLRTFSLCFKNKQLEMTLEKYKQGIKERKNAKKRKREANKD